MVGILDYLVSDDGPGSLREGCRKKEPLWIVFDVSGIIHLSSYLSVSSYKTVDGRGQRIKFTGKGLRLKECEHVIVCNLEFEGGRGHDVDGIQIKPNSKHLWIDRCSLRDYDDGLIDITRQSTDITVSRWVFTVISSFNCFIVKIVMIWILNLQVSFCSTWQDHADWSRSNPCWWQMYQGDNSPLLFRWNQAATTSS